MPPPPFLWRTNFGTRPVWILFFLTEEPKINLKQLDANIKGVDNRIRGCWSLTLHGWRGGRIRYNAQSSEKSFKKHITSKPFTLFLNRVRTKFSVVDDDNDMQVVRSRTRPRKYGQNPRKMEATKDLKASKNASLKQNIDESSINNASYQTENAGYITPLPPPLVSTCRCLNSIKKWFSCLCTNYITSLFSSYTGVHLTKVFLSANEN